METAILVVGKRFGAGGVLLASFSLWALLSYLAAVVGLVFSKVVAGLLSFSVALSFPIWIGYYVFKKYLRK